MKNKSNKNIRSLFIVAILLVTFQSTTAQIDFLHGLDTYIEKSMKNWQVPGLAIGIVKDDALIFAKGYGIQNINSKDKVDKHTLFAIASNSKAFTASLLGMLVEEGKINWDTRVLEYISHLQMYDPYVTREINVRDLLTHRSGLPTFGGDHLWIGNSLSREKIIARLRYLKPTAQFRTKFQYQNLMFLIAGQLYHAITNQKWEDGIQERIFQTLGMMESNSDIRDLQGNNNVARPHELVNGKVSTVQFDDMKNVAPAGAINSNVVDMSKWMRLNLNRGGFGDKKIVSEGIIKTMHTIQFSLPISSFNEKNFNTRFSGYGLGWNISDYKGYKMISHGGGLSGMISLQTLIPEKNFGILVLTNFAPNSLTNVITYHILDAFLGEPETDWNKIYLNRRDFGKKRQEQREKQLQEKRHKDTKPSLLLEAYTGKYVDTFSGDAEVRLENGKLVFDYNPRHLGDLIHWHHNTFRVIWRNPIFDMPSKSFLTFYLDELGGVEKLKVTFYDPIYFIKSE